MIGGYTRQAGINPLLRNQVGQLQAQLSDALNAFTATGTVSTLVRALQIQSQISQLLLEATALSTAASVAQTESIRRL